MDVIVHFWSEREGQVITEYLGTLVDNFESSLSKLGMRNLVQISVVIL